ncbi:MAG: putative DNA binding domain-containing protein [Candidatus Thermoplasmatota archaeon]|nr:putative DNA binding domain-containing protein [Candidatus Thermoplasmatota archaeon]
MQQSLLIDLIKRGENESIEFKRKVTNNIGEDICAMANSRGGHILIGIDDNGTIVGCDPKRSKESVSQHLGSIVPPIDISFSDVTIDEKAILAIKVERSENLCSISGMAYIRTGIVKRPLSIQELFQLGSENLLFDVDRSSSGERTVDEKAIERFISTSRVKIADPRKYMERMNVWAKDGTLSVAGLLMFGMDPQEVLPHTAVRLTFADGSWLRLTGAYPDVVDSAEKEFMSRIPITSRKRGFKREDTRVYPIRALKEALVNAMVHRNLAIRSEVFVNIAPDMIEIKNPGSFPPGTTPEDPHPIPRNPILYELMFLAGYVERQGSGIDMIKSECETSGNVSYEYKLSQAYTTLTFTKKSPDQNKTMQEIISKLSEGDMSMSEIAVRIGVARITVMRNMKRLLESGYVERIGQGPLTRYRLKG